MAGKQERLRPYLSREESKLLTAKILYLYCEEGLTITQIAKQVNLHNQAVNQRLARIPGNTANRAKMQLIIINYWKNRDKNTYILCKCCQDFGCAKGCSCFNLKTPERREVKED